MKKLKPQTTFSDRVLKIALSIPKGRVTTYGRIARAAGAGPMASMSVTSILGKAHMAGNKTIPFHRIVFSNGKVWMNEKYNAKRRALYKAEGIEVDKRGKILNFEDILLEFK